MCSVHIKFSRYCCHPRPGDPICSSYGVNCTCTFIQRKCNQICTLSPQWGDDIETIDLFPLCWRTTDWEQPSHECCSWRLLAGFGQELDNTVHLALSRDDYTHGNQMTYTCSKRKTMWGLKVMGKKRKLSESREVKSQKEFGTFHDPLFQFFGIARVHKDADRALRVWMIAYMHLNTITTIITYI